MNFNLLKWGKLVRLIKLKIFNKNINKNNVHSSLFSLTIMKMMKIVIDKKKLNLKILIIINL